MVTKIKIKNEKSVNTIVVKNFWRKGERYFDMECATLEVNGVESDLEWNDELVMYPWLIDVLLDDLDINTEEAEPVLRALMKRVCLRKITDGSFLGAFTVGEIKEFAWGVYEGFQATKNCDKEPH
jgi:hypothetical protein